MKRFVDMIVRFKEDGQIIPLQINWGAENSALIFRPGMRALS